MNKSYVYVVTNKLDGKRYVGKTDDPVNRWKGLKWKKGTQRVQGAIAREGEENFEFEIVSEHDTESKAYQEENRLMTLWDTRNPNKGYNVGTGTPNRKKSPSRYKKQKSPESRLRTIKVHKNLKPASTFNSFNKCFCNTLDLCDTCV